MHVMQRPVAALFGVAAIASFAAAALGALAGCGPDSDAWGAPPQAVPGGDARRGAARIARYGCGSCHAIPGIRGATALVAPPLTAFGARIYVAGVLPNTPENLMRWIESPQAVLPGNAMPDMGVTPADARDIAAYLYTLR